MAEFGDKGRFRVTTPDGVAFYIDANSPTEAAGILRQKLESGETTVAARAKRLGLDVRDTAALAARAARSREQARAGEPIDPDAAVRGVTDVVGSLEGVGISPVRSLANMGVPAAVAAERLGFDPTIPLVDDAARTLIGIGRYAKSRQRGIQQIVAGPEEEQVLAREAQSEQDVYNQFGSGLGLEDVGEAIIPLLSFYATGGLSGGSVAVAGLTGAGLNAAEEQTDPSASGRLGKAARGFAEGAIGQKVGNFLFGKAAGQTGPSLLSRLSTLFRGQSIGAGGPRQYLNLGALFRRAPVSQPAAEVATGITSDAVEASARAMFREEQSALYDKLGRAVLDKVEEGIRSLPVTERAGALGATQEGLFQGILKASMEESKQGGFAVINPAKWQAAMSETVGRLPSLFKHPGHAQMVTDMNALVRAMADLRATGANFTPDSVESAIKALQRTAIGNVNGTLPGALSTAARGSTAEAEASALRAALEAMRNAEPGSDAQRTMLELFFEKAKNISGAAGERGSEEAVDYVEGKIDNFTDQFSRVF